MDQRFPNPVGEGAKAEIEVRQLYELDDLGASEAIERFRELEARKEWSVASLLARMDLAKWPGSSIWDVEPTSLPAYSGRITGKPEIMGSSVKISTDKRAYVD